MKTQLIIMALLLNGAFLSIQAGAQTQQSLLVDCKAIIVEKQKGLYALVGAFREVASSIRSGSCDLNDVPIFLSTINVHLKNFANYFPKACESYVNSKQKSRIKEVILETDMLVKAMEREDVDQSNYAILIENLSDALSQATRRLRKL